MTDSSFHDIRLPDDVEQGAQGGPSFLTTVVAMGGGDEQRNAEWSAARLSWDIAYGIRTKDLFETTIAFFRARKGRLHGFRFRDWSDFESAPAPGETLGVGVDAVAATGLLTFTAEPLNNETVVIGATTYTFKTTLTGAANEVLRGASAATSCANLIAAVTAGAGIGTTYGTGTTANATATASAGAGTTVVVTALTAGVAGNSIVTTETSTVGSFAAATLLGGLEKLRLFQLIKTYEDSEGSDVRVITRPVDVDPDTSLHTIFVYVNGVLKTETTDWVLADGGIINFNTSHEPAAGATVSAVFEFDVPVRFDVDKMSVSLMWYNAGAINSLPIIELRDEAF